MTRPIIHLPLADLSADYNVAIPVSVSDTGALVPREIPEQIAGMEVPRHFDAAWCQRHGLRDVGGSAVVLRSLAGATITLVRVGISLESIRQAGASAARVNVEGPLGLALPSSYVLDLPSFASAFLEGALLASYRYRRESDTPVALTLCAEQEDSADLLDLVERDVNRARVVADTTNWARRIINTPAQDMNPKILAREIDEQLSTGQDVSVEIWTESKLRREGFGGVLGVGMGSAQPCRVVVAEYRPGDSLDYPHVVLVGKGVTFDSGGLSLKPPAAMALQKTDMTGAAVVAGAFAAVSSLRLPIHLTMIALLAENMTGPAAMRPGDVLTIRDGQTIEVLNTDAEGRLLLADGLSLASELNPQAIVDVATLTGAQRVALGNDVGALFSSSDELASALADAGQEAGEPLWRLPLVDSYERHLDSEFADMNNQGVPGQAGSITAALLLRRFTKGLAWAHLDIAGPGRSDKAQGYLCPGGTAFALRTLVTWLETLGSPR